MSSSASARPKVGAGQGESPASAQGPGEPTKSVADTLDSFFELIPHPGTSAARRANISLDEITWERCVCCGQPAKVSYLHLRRRERILLCGTCRPPGPPSASKVPTPE